MTAKTPNSSYDEVEYQSYPFPQTHPARLATIATLLGMCPPPIERARVLELGCSSGGNLIPLADQFPDGQYVGVDASAKAIEKAVAMTQAIGLNNIRFQQCNILEIDESLGQFDYILCHGVYSWVPGEVQSKILQIIANHLSPSGVAYVSYNTYPGWHFRGMIRDVMAYHAKFFNSPEQQLNEARALVNFLAESVPTENNPFGMLLSRELELLRDKHHYYLYHEFLEEHNEPFYFHQFAERLQGFGLQYLGEADYSTMSASNFPARVEELLHKVSDDTIRMEQYMDFVRNRMFRQTLICRGEQTLKRIPGPKTLTNMYVASDAKPDGELAIHSREPTLFRRPGSTLTTSEPLFKAAMQHLAEIWPRSILFPDLVVAARRKLNQSPQLVDPERINYENKVIGFPLLRCFSTTHVDLSVCPSVFAIHPGELPTASRLSRYQASQSNQITNLSHASVRINDLQRHLLQQLDGRHDRQALIDYLIRQVQTGKLVAQEQGAEVREENRIREILAQILESNLVELAQQYLLTQ